MTERSGVLDVVAVAKPVFSGTVDRGEHRPEHTLGGLGESHTYRAPFEFTPTCAWPFVPNIPDWYPAFAR
jgi:hypothetical protein